MRYVCLAIFALAFSPCCYATTCKEILYYYNAGPPPKAYAESGKYCGSSTANTAFSLEDAKFKAMKFCVQGGGRDCHVTRSQGK
jgi:hypothetical protein